jgi:hypothetical protein
MRVEMATEPAYPGRPNEDFVGATATGVVLLDGAGIDPPYAGCKHGVAWFAHQLGGHLLAGMDDTSRDLATILAEAIEATADQHAGSCDLSDPNAPSATVVMVRPAADGVEHLVLADSVLVLVDRDGAVQTICDEREALVGRAYRSDLDAAAIGTQEHTEARRSYLRAMSSHRNQRDGFWVAAANPDAAKHALVGCTSRLRCALLLSDGASRLVDRFHLATWVQLLAIAESQGAGEVIRRVRDAESTDPGGRQWPRGKARDDATVALATA